MGPKVIGDCSKFLPSQQLKKKKHADNLQQAKSWWGEGILSRKFIEPVTLNVYENKTSPHVFSSFSLMNTLMMVNWILAENEFISNIEKKCLI